MLLKQVSQGPYLYNFFIFVLKLQQVAAFNLKIHIFLQGSMYLHLPKVQALSCYDAWNSFFRDFLCSYRHLSTSTLLGVGKRRTFHTHMQIHTHTHSLWCSYTQMWFQVTPTMMSSGVDLQSSHGTPTPTCLFRETVLPDEQIDTCFSLTLAVLKSFLRALFLSLSRTWAVFIQARYWQAVRRRSWRCAHLPC